MKTVLTLTAVAFLSSIVSVFVYSQVQNHPGAAPFTPSRIDWLVTTLQASLRTEAMDTYGYQLEITDPDSETILIYVRHLPTVNREVMNLDIDTARKVIDITVKGYHWENWVKVREDVQLGELQRTR